MTKHHTGRLHLIDQGEIISVRGEGFLTADLIERHFDELAAKLAQRRRNGRPIRVRVDLMNAGVRSSDVATRIGSAAGYLYRSEDRVAVIVGSALQKMQMARVHAGSAFGIFLSPIDADAFLTCAQEALGLSAFES